MEILVGSEDAGVVLVTRHYRRPFQQKLSRCDGDAVFMSYLACNIVNLVLV